MEDKPSDGKAGPEIQKEETAPYVIELFFEKKPELDKDSLLEALKKYTSNPEIDTFSETERTTLAAGDIQNPACRIKISMEQIPFDRETLLDYASSLRQSWSWRTAKETIQNCTMIIKISDEYSDKIAYNDRVNLLRNILRGIVEKIGCCAVHFPVTQQFAKPENYVYSFCDPSPDKLYGFINVRFFKIHDSDDMVMDTIGLNAIGLNDVQCSFKRYNPKDISNILFNTAYYLFDNGNAIIDGDTVQGLKRTDKWACKKELSLVAPKRMVLDIAPGLYK